MFRSLVLIVFIGFIMLAHANTGPERSLVRIELGTNSGAGIHHILEMGVDMTYFNGHKQVVEAIVSQEQIVAIRKLGFKVTPIIPDLVARTESMLNEDYFKPFHTYDEMLQEMQDIVSSYPDLASLHDIGDSYNKIYGAGGYDIWALKISDNVKVEDDSEAEILIMANVHAREIITPEIVMYYMHYLIDHYSSDAYVTHLVNNREIWLIPTCNPDGHEFVFTGDINQGLWNTPIAWRKNMRDNNNNGIFEMSSDGVDLNRNFGFQWGYNNSGSSPDPSSDLYRGTAPFSEPESQVIRDFVEQHDFIISLSYHSYGQLLLYPWSYVPENPPAPDGDSFVALADSCVAYNGYEPGNFATGTIYEVNGDTDDWFYGEHGIFAFTPEVGSSQQGWFWPDTTLILPLVLENLGPNLFMTYAAGEEPTIEYEPLPDYEIGPENIQFTATVKPPILLTDFVPFDTSTFKIYFNTTPTAPFDSVLLQPTGIGAEFAADIPAENLNGTVYYYASACDKSGRRGSWPRGAPMAVDSFTIAPDVIPPTIVHEPMLFQPPFMSSLNISAEVNDNLGLAKVVLQIRQNTEPVQEKIMNMVEGNTYSATLDEFTISAGDSFAYRIIAQDASPNQNTTTAPEEGWYTFGIFTSAAFYDFEQDSICVTNTESDWEWGIPVVGPDSAHSGEKLWGTNLDGYYSDLSDSKLDVPEFQLDETLENAGFLFWHWYRTEMSQGSFWDGGNVQISLDGGPFQVIEPREGYDGVIDPYNPTIGGEAGFAGPPQLFAQWVPEIIDLKAYIGQTIQFRFHFASDDNTPDDGWYIDDIEFLVFPATETEVDNLGLQAPRNFVLEQNYPNPFNAQTRIEYVLSRDGFVTLGIYNQLGQSVCTLYQGRQSAGSHRVVWDGTDETGTLVVSGLYFYIFEFNGITIVRKMLHLK